MLAPTARHPLRLTWRHSRTDNGRPEEHRMSTEWLRKSMEANGSHCSANNSVHFYNASESYKKCLHCFGSSALFCTLQRSSALFCTPLTFGASALMASHIKFASFHVLFGAIKRSHIWISKNSRDLQKNIFHSLLQITTDIAMYGTLYTEPITWNWNRNSEQKLLIFSLGYTFHWCRSCRANKCRIVYRPQYLKEILIRISYYLWVCFVCEWLLRCVTQLKNNCRLSELKILTMFSMLSGMASVTALSASSSLWTAWVLSCTVFVIFDCILCPSPTSPDDSSGLLLDQILLAIDSSIES